MVLLHRGTLDDDILAELLEQQGVPFKPVAAGGPMRHGPVALISRSTPEAFDRAADACFGRKESVWVAAEMRDFEAIKHLLGGLRNNKKDNFDLPVNEEGRRLVFAIGRKMSEMGLPLVLKSAG